MDGFLGTGMCRLELGATPQNTHRGLTSLDKKCRYRYQTKIYERYDDEKKYNLFSDVPHVRVEYGG